MIALLALTPVVADLAATIAPRAGFWSQLPPSLYYACIVIGGLEFGWRIGLGLALFAGVTHSTIARLLLDSPFVQLEAQLLAFLIVGFAFLDERKRERKELKPGASVLPRQAVRTEECVEQVSTMVREFLREVRTPLASIEGAAFILEEDSTPPERRNEFVGIILNECNRIRGTLSELNESTEAVPLACRPTDASSLLGEVIRLAALERPNLEISLRIEVAPDLPPLWCDPARIEQTLVPFVTSAMEAVAEGGQILLSAESQNGQARIQLQVLGQTVRSSDAAAGRGSYSSTFDASVEVRVLAARRTVLQHGGTITLDQVGHLKRLLFLTLPLYNGQNS